MSSSAIPALRRALLYVPASSPRMLAKSLTLTADNVTYDLEDSVTASMKDAARAALQAHLAALADNKKKQENRPASIGEIAVRINGASTRHAEADIRAVAALASVDALVVPKVNSPADLAFVEDAVASAGPRTRPLKLLALVESARAVMDLRDICGASSRRGGGAGGGGGGLAGLIFAAEDFALDLSLRRTPGLAEFLYARSAVVTAARAFGLESAIDLVCTSYRGAEGQERLEFECQDGRNLGFTGKQCIHPNQVPTVQRMFSPSKSEVEWAVRVLVADGKASAAGRGAWSLDGKMIDAPVVGKARATVAIAKRCGFDVDSIEQGWKHQEPE